jgi:hypothetical protein
MSWDLRTLLVRHSKEIANVLRRWGVSPNNATDFAQKVFLRLRGAGTTWPNEMREPAISYAKVRRLISIEVTNVS